ncbi:hypothetical protein ACVI1J_004940 [Bradyrhizobium diazoefficiens]
MTPGAVQRRQFGGPFRHAAIDPLVDPRSRGGVALPDPGFGLVDLGNLLLDGCELFVELARSEIRM